jgi:predicted dithiol-disulfide oxidoreductase (DUF899 family)
MNKPLHQCRYPGESSEYREARDALLKAELDLVEQVEKVAAMRRNLPRGGAIRHFYSIEAHWVKAEGRDPRHLDLFWSVWHLLDLTPEGRGKDWYPT